MTVIYRVIISLAIALVFASIDYRGEHNNGDIGIHFDMVNFILFGLATLATALLTHIQPGQLSAANNQTQAGGSAKQPESAPKGKPGAGRERGTVKWFNFSKGFGFITREAGDDIFVHYRSIRGKGRRTLYEGQTVEFEVTEGSKGLQAEDVEAFKKPDK